MNKAFFTILIFVTAIVAQQNEQITAIKELERIDSLYSASELIIKQTNTRKAIVNKNYYNECIISYNKIMDEIVVAKENWKQKNPIYSKLLEKPNHNVLKAAGVAQFTLGIGGLVATIINANEEYKFGDIEAKNKWTSFHTATTLLSSALIISGVITIGF